MALDLQVQLPTDSLYKTAALSGVALLVLSYLIVLVGGFIYIQDMRSTLVEKSIAEKKLQQFDEFLKEDSTLSPDQKFMTRMSLQEASARAYVKEAVDRKLEPGVLVISGTLTLLLSLFGGFLARWGFIQWYIRLQRPLDLYYERLNKP